MGPTNFLSQLQIKASKYRYQSRDDHSEGKQERGDLIAGMLSLVLLIKPIKQMVVFT